jgi:hypothetical protein
VGAPLLARELETGTFRFAWTQGCGRARWAIIKLALLAVALTVASYAFSLLWSWYFQVFFTEGLDGLLAQQYFDPRGVDFAAWTLFAFAIGAIAGVLIRRTVPAMAASIAVWTGLDFAINLFLRKHYQAPLLSTSGTVWENNWVIGQWYTGPNGAVVSQQTIRDVVAHAPESVQHSTGHERGNGLPHRPPLHAVGQLPAGEQVLAFPAHRGRLAARAVADPARRHHLAGPPPRGMTAG